MNPPPPPPAEPQDPDPRIQKGLRLVEDLWWSLAKRIVKTAGDHYKWDDDQWKEAQELFLRPGDYKVIPIS